MDPSDNCTLIKGLVVAIFIVIKKWNNNKWIEDAARDKLQWKIREKIKNDHIPIVFIASLIGI